MHEKYIKGLEWNILDFQTGNLLPTVLDRSQTGIQLFSTEDCALTGSAGGPLATRFLLPD